MIPITNNHINSFLHFGWLPRIDIDPPFPIEWIPANKSDFVPAHQFGADLLKRAVSEIIKDHTKVIVPLSGGLDSRAVLMATLETGVDVTAVTVGVPGTFDFEIPKLVANSLGVKHEAININTIDLDTPSLVETAKQTGDWTNIIEVDFNLLIPKSYPDTPILTGLLGDFLAGSYAKHNFSSWSSAVDFFVKNNQLVKDVSLTEPGFDPKTLLPQLSQTAGINYYEELVFLARHTCSFRPTAFHNNFNCLLPFRDKAFVQLMLNLPQSERMNQKYYQEMLLATWPQAFSLPCKNNSGLPLNSNSTKRAFNRIKLALHNRFGTKLPNVHKRIYGYDYVSPYLNYIDFTKRMNTSRLSNDFFSNNLVNLRDRKMLNWINFDDIQKTLSSQKLSPDEALKILVLSTLEINLRSSV